MKAIVKNINIRGYEEKENKNGEPYLVVRFEDEAGVAASCVDKNMEHKSLYKRNTDGTLTIEITIGKSFTNLRVVDFVPDKE